MDKGRVAVFMHDGMVEFEIALAVYMLKTEMQAEIVPVGYEKGTVKTDAGISCNVETTVAELDPDSVEGIIIAGGMYRDCRPEMKRLLHDLKPQNKLIAAICVAGPMILADAGILDEIRYTTSVRRWTDEYAHRFGTADPFPRTGYVDSPCVRDGNVITADGRAFIRFSAEICDWAGLFGDGQGKAGFIRKYTE